MGQKERDSVGIMVFNDRHELLLQKKDLGHPRIPGVWCLFGGGIKSGESPLETVQREFSEETGIILTNPKLVAEYLMSLYPHPRDHPHADGREYLFRADEAGLRTSQISLREGAGFAFFDRSELEGLREQFIRYQVVMNYLKGGFSGGTP